jgi:hypothetical protein
MNTMRIIQILATFGLTALATAQIAQAGLIGAQVTYDYFFPLPLPIAIAFSLPTQTITPSTSLVDTVGRLIPLSQVGQYVV